MSELWLELSDPRRGTSPSVLNDKAILTEVSLYYLSKSFLSSIWIYSQQTLYPSYDVPKPSTPLGYSAFRFNVGWPRAFVERVSNLTFYHGMCFAISAQFSYADTIGCEEHDFGGHFPGLDNPAALVADIRELGSYYVGQKI
jgi:hypothetical protein